MIYALLLMLKSYQYETVELEANYSKERGGGFVLGHSGVLKYFT